MGEQKPSDFPARFPQSAGRLALQPSDSGGRAFDESEHPYRNCYQRDRDRIVHCSAFRRLASKTQVFIPHEQDHYRTRLTHTLEVAQIARTLARALGANEDVVEAVALGHDLGHAPFGHAGEEALDELMAGHGGFEHNRQSLRVVDFLEHPYPDFRGLNLTHIVRRCLGTHQTRYDAPAVKEFDDLPSAPLEGQLVDIADEIAYTCSDTYDALAAGWIDPDRLGGLEIWRLAWDRTGLHMPHAGDVHKRIDACRNLLGIMSDAAVAQTAGGIARMRLAGPWDVMKAPSRIVGFGEELEAMVRQLQEFLLLNVYRHSVCLSYAQQGRQIIREIFSAYLADESLLPPRYRQRIDRQGLQRTICDYIAGMTDPYAGKEHRRIRQA